MAPIGLLGELAARSIKFRQPSAVVRRKVACFAEEAGDDAWSYRPVLDIYRRVEDWRGASDAVRRGSGGPVRVETSPPTGGDCHGRGS